ncbi:DNA-binding transcriptional regulator, LysR family [Shimia gijangensis]|uniref:DNA-binding transcriptional regulator, LysR family n=1 Tax=Shimia gijangensis TaxID=1470563 RepID=A0A1M6KMT7_9RHOB|nr:LysR family transcriptional regulator [Shimia gijangensis]SHJ60206.1 DNA-binding transcriptional regulator, LysR family [Shimia gijangensis]
MNLNKLRYVTAVDREGSISAAAKVLLITQSAVTKAVADVERELGLSIFDRRARGIVTTAAGRDFVDRAARILSDMDQLVSDAKTGRDTRERVLRIGIAPPSLEGLLNRAVRHLVLNHEDVRVQLRGTPFEAGMQLLRQGDLDTLIGPTGPVSGQTGLVSEPLPPLRAHMFARKGHPLTGQKLTAAQLATYPIITPDLSGPTVVPILDILDHFEGDPVRGLHMLENFPMASGIIERSDAVGTVVETYVQSQAFKSRFEVLNFDMGDPVPMALVSRAELHPSRAMVWLRAALKAHPPTATVPGGP